MVKPIVTEKFNPNDYECTAGVCPCLDDPKCETCSLKRKKNEKKGYNKGTRFCR